MTAVSPERAAYEADPWALGIPWEELFPEDKAKYRAIAQAAMSASPELAHAREQLAAIELIASQEAARGSVAGRNRFAQAARAALARRILTVIDSKPDGAQTA